MIELVKKGVYLLKGRLVLEDSGPLELNWLNDRLFEAGMGPLSQRAIDKESARGQTITSQILNRHNYSGDKRSLKLRFDSLASHDISYVGIIQTARASGLKEFPVPYVLTNCHNSLCAVGGTINEDDHVFGLSAARKFGGIYVPSHQAVIHQYVREMVVACGEMILGSDSHTRYGALGAIGIGEGGGEIVKQLLKKTYDVVYPEVVAVYLEGSPAPGVGPQDVALAIIGAVFRDAFVTNKVMEFLGPGVSSLTVDFRNGIDVMTTETACLSSIWRTDEKVADFYRIHGRPEAYRGLEPGELSYYDGMIKVDLCRVEPMIALPFHPSNVWPISELNRHTFEILRYVEAQGKKQLGYPNLGFCLTDKIIRGRLKAEQGIVVGCSGGTFENIVALARLLEGKTIGNEEFALSVYPASQPIFLELVRNRAIEKLILAGATIRTAFCGPCFGAGDTPANNALSIRHATRNFPNREGSLPPNGQLASVALMDTRSIAATAMNGGFLAAATEMSMPEISVSYQFDKEIYGHRVYQGFRNAIPDNALIFGPNIADWPSMQTLPENLLLQVVSVIRDPVTTTDELIPSGEISSYRSNPMKLAEYTLSKRDPGYVGRAKAIQKVELRRQRLLTLGDLDEELITLFSKVFKEKPQTIKEMSELWKRTGLGSVVFALKPGDGSAREQAASCQRVLGGQANIAVEYATKRYKSNLINWGLLPFTIDSATRGILELEDLIYIPAIRQAVKNAEVEIPAYIMKPQGLTPLLLKLENLSKNDRDIILAGCLINYYVNSD
jgi:aconitate hydratase